MPLALLAMSHSPLLRPRRSPSAEVKAEVEAAFDARPAPSSTTSTRT